MLKFKFPLDSNSSAIESLFELAAIGFFADTNKLLNVNIEIFKDIDYDKFLQQAIIVCRKLLTLININRFKI